MGFAVGASSVPADRWGRARVGVLLGWAAAAVIVVGLATYMLVSPRPDVPSALQEGKPYRLRVLSAEVVERKANGKAWDWDRSAPDVYYEIWWRGNCTRSLKCTDSLLPSWPEKHFKVHVDGRIEVRKAGARVLMERGGGIRIRFIDEDVPIPMGRFSPNDEIAEVSVKLDSLVVGRNERRPASGSSVRRLVLLVEPDDAAER